MPLLHFDADISMQPALQTPNPMFLCGHWHTQGGGCSRICQALMLKLRLLS